MFMHANKEDIAAGMIAGVILGTAVGVAAKAMCDCGKKSYTQRLMEKRTRQSFWAGGSDAYKNIF